MPSNDYISRNKYLSPSIFPNQNYESGHGSSASLSAADGIQTPPTTAPQKSQIISKDDSAPSSQPDLPDDMCQVLARKYLYEHGYYGSEDLPSSIAQKMGHKYLEEHNYRKQKSGQIFPATSQQQITQSSYSLFENEAVLPISTQQTQPYQDFENFDVTNSSLMNFETIGAQFANPSVDSNNAQINIGGTSSSDLHE